MNMKNMKIQVKNIIQKFNREKKASSCGGFYCGGYSYYHYDTRKFSNDDDFKDYDRQKSCNADNIIYIWNCLYYHITNTTTYGQHTYLNSAFQANETCPLGKKMCGVLDDLEKKLCFNTKEDYPINDITLTKVDPYKSETVLAAHSKLCPWNGHMTFNYIF